MQFRSYNREAKIATSLIMNLFNNIKIGRYTKDKVCQKTILVPIVYGTRSRVLKELENVDKNLKPPVLSLVKESMSRDNSRMNELYSYMKNIATGHTIHEKMRGIPIDVEFTLSGIAVYEDDIDQIVSNFIPFFKPDVFVSWKHPKYPTEELRSQIIWDGHINYQSPVEITDKDHEFYQFETSFTFKTWFFAGLLNEASDDGPLIQKINYTANQFFDVGDEGYGSFKVYTVPKTMSFTEFEENMNNGLLDTAGEVVSYPRIVTAVSNDDVVSYAPNTSFTASTLKVSLLDEDKTATNYDATAFGFTADSKIYDCNSWHIKMDISYSNGTSGTDHNYKGISTWSDDNIETTITTILNSNYDWLAEFPSGPFTSCPCDADSDFSKNWVIEDSSGDNSKATVLFKSSDDCYTGDQLSCVTWKNLRGRTLNVKRICITASSDPSLAPRAAVMEGLSDNSHEWIIIKRLTMSSWSANETKVFDYEDDEQEYSALRITFGRPQGSGTSIAVKNFQCYSVLDYSKVPSSLNLKTTRIAESSYSISFKAKNDSNSLITMSKKITTSDPTVTTDSESFGSAITLDDDDTHCLMKPNLENLTPVMFCPMHYLIFWYKGRKYGFSVGGNINRGVAQSITYGDQFPVNVSNASMHVLTSTPGSPIYQYDAENDVWFEIGNQTRAGYQKTVLTSESGTSQETLDSGSTKSFSFDEYQAEFSIQYFTVYVSCAEGSSGTAHFSLTTEGSSTETSSYDCDVTSTPTLHRMPVIVSGSVSALKISLLAGSTINSVILSDFVLEGKLDRGDSINNPEEQNISVRNLLLNS